VVCQNYSPPEGYVPSMYSVFDLTHESVNGITRNMREIVPFMACGDLAGYDSDRTYPLEVPKRPSLFKSDVLVERGVVHAYGTTADAYITALSNRIIEKVHSLRCLNLSLRRGSTLSESFCVEPNR
jgi:hypothetical protein